jgi:maltose/maltodextrin transport system permease protein
MKNLAKLLSYVFLIIFNGVSVWAIIFLGINYSFEWMTILFVLTVFTDFVVLNPKGYPYRYMIPAVFILLVLSIYPILYTVQIAFTNYGLGHLYTKEQVVYFILNDPTYYYTPKNASQFDYYIFMKYKDSKPSNDFMVIAKSNKGKFVFLTPQPQKLFGTNIIKYKSMAYKIDSDNFYINENKYSFIRDPQTKEIIKIKSQSGDYYYFFNWNDPMTLANRKYFLNNVFPAIKSANISLPGGSMLAFTVGQGYGKMVQVKRTYDIEGKAVLEGPIQAVKPVLYNTITGNILQEKDGYFYDVNSSGKEFKLDEGYASNIGFGNFLRLIKDPKISGPFLKVFIWTFIWAFLSVFFTFTIGLFLALVLNNPDLKGRFIYRTLLIIPWAIPAFVSILMWRVGMFNDTYGLLNRFILPFFGLHPVKWLNDPFYAKVAVLVANTWLGFPYMMTVSLGALQSVPSELYEAARVDGANKKSMFSNITLPLIMIAVGPLLVGSFSFNFNNFTGIYLLTGGGPALPNSVTPAGATDILLSYTYKLAFEGGRGNNYGLASAVSIIIFIIIASISLVNFKLSNTFGEEY